MNRRVAKAGAPADLRARFADGVMAFQRGDLDAAEAQFRRCLIHGAGATMAIFNLGIIARLRNRHVDAVRFLRETVARERDHAEAWVNLSLSLLELGEAAEAREAAARAVALQPRVPAIQATFAQALEAAGEIEAAVAACRQAIALDPAFTPAHFRLLTLLRSSSDLEGSFACCDALLAIFPDSVDALLARGNTYQQVRNFPAGLADFKRAMDLAPDDWRVYFNIGHLYHEAKQHGNAIPFLEEATRHKPDDADVLICLAESQRHLRNYAAALHALRRAVAVAPHRVDAVKALCWGRMLACDWEGLDRLFAPCLANDDGIGDHNFVPFELLALGLPPQRIAKRTRRWTEHNLKAPARPLERRAVAPDAAGRIRVGYLSADFRDHAVAALVVDLFETQRHDRFEWFGYGLGQQDGTMLARRMARALDHFTPLQTLGDRDAAQRIADDGIEILVDLTGHTADGRPKILTYRPAPIQVNFLGYPGTMGMREVDYIVADAIVAPPEHAPFYDERIVTLPNAYQPNDRRRPRPDSTASRSAQGLPEQGVVFCCFNAAFKITPLMFGIWMRLLAAVPGSVLWLLEADRLACDNLRREATKRGIAAERLVFAKRCSHAEHLGRLGLADLVLDTLPYNAHTTASDALWAGLPLVTCMGSYFPERVAASLLMAAGLPELVATDLAGYEAIALALAQNPDALASMKARIEAGRSTCALFDTPRFARNFEAAIERMVSLSRAGRPAEAFTVHEAPASA